jgi:hypothetical protein
VVPELMKLRLLNDLPDTNPSRASFLGVMQKGNKRRRMMSYSSMSFAGAGGPSKIGEEDEDITVVDEDPFVALQGQASRRLEKIKQSFKGHF